MQDASARTRLDPASRWLAPGATACAYFASAVAGLAAGRGTDGIAAFWPANGILLSALLLCAPGRRWRHVALCLPASVGALYWSGLPASLCAVFTAANLFTALFAMTILRRLGGGADAFESIDGAGRFLLATAAAVATGATIAALGLAHFGNGFWSAWGRWATGDMLGIALFGSLILTSVREFARRAPGSGVRRIGALAWPILLVVVLTAAVFAQSRLPLLFVPLAALLIATYRSGLTGAVLGTTSVAIIGSVSLILGHGPITMVTGPVWLKVEFFQFYLAVLFGTCLPLATLLAERARLAHERAESDLRHRRILERSRDVIFETDPSGRWTYLSDAWAQLTGLPAADSLGTSFLTVIAEDERPIALHRLAALYRGEIDECQQELRFVRADGDVRRASVASRLLRDEHGAIAGTYGTIHDATDQRRADDARLESERLYKLLADHSNDMIVRLSLQGVRRYVSPASITVLGYTPEELVDHPAAGAIHPDDRATAIATCQSLLHGASNPMCVYRQLHKDGSYVWLEASYRLVRDDAGAPVELIATVRDVGGREQAELERFTATAKLGEANRLLLMAEELSRVGHWRVDVASQSAFWSDVVCAIHGQPNGYAPRLDEAIAAYHPDDRAAVQEHVDRAMTSGTPFAFDARIVRTDGAVRHIISRGRTETAPDGSVVGMFGVVQDVTEAHEANAALERASRSLRDNNRLLTMAETVGKLGHWRIDNRDGGMVWSDEIYRIYGLPRDVVPTVENALRIYHPDDVVAIRDKIAEARAQGRSYTSQSRIVRPDGTLAHILTRGETEYDVDGVATGLFGILQDITEQVEAEAQLQDREARFRLLTEEASDMISLHDVRGRCLFMSPSVRAILGYEPADVRDRPLSALFAADDLPLIDRLRADLAARKPGEVSTMRVRMRRRDGSLVWMEAAARIAEYRQQPRIIVVSRDVSDQVRAEEELEAARVQAEAAAKAKSSFLANMSHEIRTPMNGVIGFTELLLAGSLSEEQRRQAELIADSGRAMMRLLNDILDLSKVEAGQMIVAREPFDLRHTLRACMKLVTPALEKKGLEPRCDFAEDLPRTVSGDSLRVRQILLNLLGNAAKFTADGSVTLRAAPIPGGGVSIEVEDTGIGIAKDRQKSVFDQFVQADGTIATRYGGTGLGLAISVQLAELMGGGLRLESEPGRGTTFALTLPLVAVSEAVAPAPARTAAPATPPAARNAVRPRVLVAEDHDVNRLLMCAILDKLGYDCILAHDGGEAIAKVADAIRSGERYAAVLMDMQMPVLDGLEATRHIRASGVSAGDLPIVALTANAYADDIAACLDAGMQAHLAKPVALADLDAMLRRWAVAPVVTAAAATLFKPAIQERYRARRTETLEALSRMVRLGRFEDAEIAAVADLLHKLAGTAGMFGEGVLGEEARALEAGLHAWPAEERADHVSRAFETIKAVAAA